MSARDGENKAESINSRASHLPHNSCLGGIFLEHKGVSKFEVLQSQGHRIIRDGGCGWHRVFVLCVGVKG